MISSRTSVISRARDALAPSQCSVRGQCVLRGQMMRAGRDKASSTQAMFSTLAAPLIASAAALGILASPYHHSRRELDFFPGFDRIRLAREEAPEWNLGTQQCAGEETALKIAPGVQHVLRVHARGEFRATFRAAAHFPASGMRGLESI